MKYTKTITKMPVFPPAAGYKFIGRYLFLVLYMAIILLYAAVSLQSPGYDDEFFNISIIEKLGFGAIGYLQHSDVHPPLSYIINAVLFKMFSNWSAIRLLSGLLTAFALIYVIDRERKASGWQHVMIVFFLLALNPALLMWCTGIRWYAYFLPVLMYLVFRPAPKGMKGWMIILLGITILAYTGYIAFLIFIPLLFLYWVCSDDPAKNRIRYILYLSPVFLLLYSYQLYYFLNVHIHGSRKEVKYTVVENLRGYFVSQVSNQGVFPLSIPALLSIIGFICIVFCIVAYLLKKPDSKSMAIVAIYALAAVLLLASGVAGKPRNLVVLIPFQVTLILYFYSKLSGNKLYLYSVGLVAVANIWGCVNVFAHRDTTKNSWNLPVGQTVAAIDSIRKNDSSLVIFTHDPTLTYVLQRQHYNVVSLYNSNKASQFSNQATAIFIHTFRGSIKMQFYDSLISEENRIRYAGKNEIRIGHDQFYRWKRKVAKDYPEYQVEMSIYQHAENLRYLNFWNRKNYLKKSK